MVSLKMTEQTIYTSAIVVPCYNEFARLSADSFIDHLKLHPQHAICFVNDGSKDATIDLLTQIKQECSNAFVLDEKENGGKAVAVYKGIHFSIKNIPAEFYGYMDADLATPLSFISVMEKEMLSNKNVSLVLGSRHLADKNSIERKAFRHYSGRMVSKMITWALGVKYGDTQCGAKLLRREGVEIGFSSNFKSTWVFDVELIKRLINHFGKSEVHNKIKEIPVNQWKDVGNSKVSSSYIFRMIGEIIGIKRMK